MGACYGDNNVFRLFRVCQPYIKIKFLAQLMYSLASVPYCLFRVSEPVMQYIGVFNYLVKRRADFILVAVIIYRGAYYLRFFVGCNRHLVKHCSDVWLTLMHVGRDRPYPDY